MRVTTIPFSFTLAAGAVGYQLAQPLTTPFKITHLYILGEPSPNQLLWVEIFKWSTGTPPAAGIPAGQTIFEDVITQPRLRVGRIPTDMNLDITINTPYLLCYADNTGNATVQQCMVELEVVLL